MSPYKSLLSSPKVVSFAYFKSFGALFLEYQNKQLCTGGRKSGNCTYVIALYPEKSQIGHAGWKLM